MLAFVLKISSLVQVAEIVGQVGGFTSVFFKESDLYHVTLLF